MEATARRPHRRASFGYKVRAQVMITTDTAADIRTLADLREVSEGEIITGGSGRIPAGRLEAGEVDGGEAWRAESDGMTGRRLMIPARFERCVLQTTNPPTWREAGGAKVSNHKTSYGKDGE